MSRLSGYGSESLNRAARTIPPGERLPRVPCWPVCRVHGKASSAPQRLLDPPSHMAGTQASLSSPPSLRSAFHGSLIRPGLTHSLNKCLLGALYALSPDARNSKQSR